MTSHVISQNRREVNWFHFIAHNAFDTAFKAVQNAWCVVKWNQLISLLFWKFHVMSLNVQHLNTRTQLAKNLKLIRGQPGLKEPSVGVLY